jgi:hypothetical protein
MDSWGWGEREGGIRTTTKESMIFFPIIFLLHYRTENCRWRCTPSWRSWPAAALPRTKPRLSPAKQLSISLQVSLFYGGFDTGKGEEQAKRPRLFSLSLKLLHVDVSVTVNRHRLNMQNREKKE